MPYSLELKAVSRPQPGVPDAGTITRKDLEHILRVSIVLLFVGLFGVLVTTWIYRPLDSNWIYMSALGLFLSPLAFYFASLIRKREAQQAYFLRTIFRCSAALLIAFACALIANGSLDHAPPQKIQSIVLRKYLTHGRRSTTHHIDVRSWRPGRSDEDLQVGTRTYSALAEGREVSIELHPGYLSVPWYGRVVPE